MKKILTLLIAWLAIPLAYGATRVQIGDLYYNLDEVSMTAEVTYDIFQDNENYLNLPNELVLPAAVVYENLEYKVVSIGEYAFARCMSITDITIPPSVNKICTGAFAYCYLSNFILENGEETIEMVVDSFGMPGIQYYDEWIYSYNYKLGYGYCIIQNFYMGRNIKTSFKTYEKGDEGAIPYREYERAYGPGFEVRSLEIGQSVTFIDDYLFEKCSFPNLTILPSITSIGKLSFNRVNELIISDGNSELDMGAGAFRGGTDNLYIGRKIKSSTYSEIYYWEPVGGSKKAREYVGPCMNPKLIKFGDNVRGIGDYAFADCSRLTSVEIPNSVTSIGEKAFWGCDRLTSVEIDNAPTSIGVSAFMECSNLTSIELGNAVISIGDHAFSSCRGLTSVTIPNSLTFIGGSAFDGCSRLTSVEIPNSVISIGDYAFRGCSGLTRVDITDLGAWCKIDFGNYDANPLYYAGHLYLNNEEITDLIIPASVSKIGSYAFYKCSGLTSVEIPNSVSSIGSESFSGCPIETLSIDCTNISDWFKANSSIKNLIIGNSVTSIGDYAFRGCSGLTGVEIPNSVTSIGSSAFYGCSGLTSVTIPNSVTSIGNSAFYGCSGLKKVNISDLDAWCDIDFLSATSNPLYYAGHLYLNNEEITELSIPRSINEIKDHTFNGCSGLTNVSFPVSLIQIGGSAFKNCDGLNRIIFNSNQLLMIKGEAFSGCENLSSIICNTLRPPVSDDKYIFDTSTYSKSTLFVPVSQLNLYYTMDPWKYFSNISTISGISNIEIQAYGDTEMQTGTTLQLYLTTPEIPGLILNADTWSSSDMNVASVNGQGFVMAVSPGTAVITASDAYGHNASVIITVKSEGTSWIESVDPGAENPIYIILTIGGIVIKENATQEDINTLAPGLYIIGGKKVIVK